jgi:hypothetical protein
MPQQVFVNLNSQEKFMMVVSVSHVAQSIRMRGSGILNTAVRTWFLIEIIIFQIFLL